MIKGHFKAFSILIAGLFVVILELFTPMAPVERCIGFWVAHMPEFELSTIIGKNEAKRFRNLNIVMDNYIQKNTIYDTNGTVIAQSNELVNAPPYLNKYLVDLENSRYYNTFVIDWPSVFRAVFTDITHGRFVEGASGIIQQFSRGIILRDDKKFWVRKVKEALISFGLGYKYTHQQLLHFYMSSVFLGSFEKPPMQIRGMKRGAKILYGKDISDLTKPEALGLITLINSPNTYLKNKTDFQSRYKRLARSLKSRGIITNADYQKLIHHMPALPLKKIKARASKIEYRKQIITQLIPFYPNGKIVHSTIDLQVTTAANKTLKMAIKDFTKQTGISDLDGFMIVAHNDSLLAMIGSAETGDNYMNNIEIRSAWRPGSLAKPFIYSEYISQGGNIYQKLPADGPKTFTLTDGSWTVKNYSSRDNDPHRQKAINALARSNNVAAAYLAVNYGDSLLERLHRAGADSTFSPYPATFIGADAPRPIDLFRLLQAYVPPYGKIPDHFLIRKKDTTGFATLFSKGVARETAFCLTNAFKDPMGTLHFTEARYHWNSDQFLGKTGTAQQSTSAGLFIARPNGVSVLMGVFSRSGKSLRYLSGGAIQGASLAPYMDHFFNAPSIRKRIHGQFHFGRDEFNAKKDHFVKKIKSMWDKVTSIFK